MALSTSGGGRSIDDHVNIVLTALLIREDQPLTEPEKKSLAKVLLHPKAYRAPIPYMNRIRINGGFDLSTREPTQISGDQATILSIILFSNDSINQLNLNNVTIPKENLKGLARVCMGIANIQSNQMELLNLIMLTFIETEKRITQILLPQLLPVKDLVGLINEYAHYRQLMRRSSFEPFKALFSKALSLPNEANVPLRDNKEEKDGKEIAAAAAALNNAAPMGNANAIVPPPAVIHHAAPPPLLHAAPMGNANAAMLPVLPIAPPPNRREPEERIENESEENAPRRPKRK